MFTVSCQAEVLIKQKPTEAEHAKDINQPVQLFLSIAQQNVQQSKLQETLK